MLVLELVVVGWCGTAIPFARLFRERKVEAKGREVRGAMGRLRHEGQLSGSGSRAHWARRSCDARVNEAPFPLPAPR